MFKRYSLSADLGKAFLGAYILFFIALFFKINIAVFNTKDVSNILIQTFIALAGFILPVLILLFTLDPSKNPIFRYLEQINLYHQIFKRFFDSLIALLAVSFYLLVVYTYFEEPIGVYGKIINFLIIAGGLLVCLRLYYCLKLLKLVYGAKTEKIE